jgi:hypothetical protein
LKVLPLAPFRSVLKLERRVSHEGMVSVGGNLYRVPDATRKRTVEVHTFANEVQIFDDGDGHPAIQSLPPHFSIDCSTMPSSSRSKARATTCANMPISCRSTFAPRLSSTHQSRHRRCGVAVGHPKMDLSMIISPVDHRNHLPEEFYFGTSEEN